jgi:hypothetical protein
MQERAIDRLSKLLPGLWRVYRKWRLDYAARIRVVLPLRELCRDEQR